MSVALKVEDVAIRYITGDFKDIGVKEYVIRKFMKNYHVTEFLAVNGISFELEKGDMLGIIGTNGAGKSTLLKAVAGIMEPTHGKITANGEVAALLELGSGFDGDLTVRENAYLRGAMLGYTRAFMDETYEQIIDFAELREFQDRPFKQLSSGMKSRLAFSIASLVQPDILILDEVLSVGDGSFQEKSAKKMKEIISHGATTILVSHSLNQIRELCNKVLWINHGHQVAFGETKKICNQYERFLRGECPAEMYEAPGMPQSEITEPAEISAQRSIPRKWIPGAVLCAMAFGLVAAIITFGAAYQLLENKNFSEKIQIYADILGGKVIYRGAMIDGIWYDPMETVVASGEWIFCEEDRTFIATREDDPLTIHLPRYSERSMTFDVGPKHGIARVKLSNETVCFDLSSEVEVPLGRPYKLPTSQVLIRNGNVAVFAATVVFILAVLVVLYLSKKYISTV